MAEKRGRSEEAKDAEQSDAETPKDKPRAEEREAKDSKTSDNTDRGTFLSNSGDIILDADLTAEGRQRLAREDTEVSQRKFDLQDEEKNVSAMERQPTNDKDAEQPNASVRVDTQSSEVRRTPPSDFGSTMKSASAGSETTSEASEGISATVVPAAGQMDNLQAQSEGNDEPAYEGMAKKDDETTDITYITRAPIELDDADDWDEPEDRRDEVDRDDEDEDD